ncbi:hypothetical protein B0H14DRAFT_3714131, partial [Mycena olivaceomarginata]
MFVTHDALRLRLDCESTREADYEAMRASDTACPIKLWDSTGDLCPCPRGLILVPDEYNDTAQLQRWVDFAARLVKKPRSNINPTYARFRLKPSEKLKATINVYFTPCDTPVCGIERTTLEAIVKENEGKFKDWPTPRVLDFAEARAKGLKVVGANFMLFYIVWMDLKDYQQLWNEWGVQTLAIPFPGDDATVFETINKDVKKGKRDLDGLPILITSRKIEMAIGMRDGQAGDVMGMSATRICEALWGTNPPSTHMAPWATEWLHRSACAYGGLDKTVSLATFMDAGNLIFGTWECNAEMLRVENFVTQLTKRVKGGRGAAKDVKFAGTLITTNNYAGAVSRRSLEAQNTSATIPKWVAEKKYSWLCFQLNYQYVIPAETSLLGCDLLGTTTFDPWSLYMPLQIEPYMDMMVLKYLRDSRYPVTAGTLPTPAMFSTPRLCRSRTVQTQDHDRHYPDPGTTCDIAPDFCNSYPGENGMLRILHAGESISPSHRPPISMSREPTIGSSVDGDGIADPCDNHLLHTQPRDVEGKFVSQGEIKLFGGDQVGNLEKWLGPAPAGIVVELEPTLIEKVELIGDFHLSGLTRFEGIPRDDITLEHVVFYHQNCIFETRAVGWHMTAEWVIEPSRGMLYDLLSSMLQGGPLVLSIRASLGKQQWNIPLNLHSFIFEGMFSGQTYAPISGIHFTSIGVRLLGIRGLALEPQPHSKLSYGFSVFGTMTLDVPGPGAAIPMDLQYEMGMVGSTVNLNAQLTGQIWSDALGVRNLTLEDVSFRTSLALSSQPWDSVALEVSATFWYLDSSAVFEGSYTPCGQFALKAELNDFGTRDIDNIFFTLFDDSLTLPEFNVHVGSAVLTVVSGTELSISLRDVRVSDYTAVDVAAAFTTSGVALSGALCSKEIAFGDILLHDAMLELFLWTSRRKKQAEITLRGTVVVKSLGMTVGAAVHLYPGHDGFEWTVVAELSAAERSLGLSEVISEVKNTPLDFPLQNAVFMAASKDDPVIARSYPNYSVREGVQVFGVIDRIPCLKSLLRGEDVSGLVLCAGWSKSSGVSIAVTLPEERSLCLGNGITTTPISLMIRTRPVQLAVIAGLKVPIRDSTPLEFSLVLALDDTGASAAAEMKGWWVKPFGVENLKIGPTVALSLEIRYAQFLLTGIPSGFGVAGGLMIGRVEARIAINISEHPTRQMLSASLKKLSISDLVTFAGELLQQNIPNIGDDLITFEELDIYVCPFGIILGKISYPRGFSLHARMMLFQKSAHIRCVIDSAQKSIYIAGRMENFELGPLSLRGSEGPHAKLECHIGVSKQKLTLHGVLSLFQMEVLTRVELQFMPQPRLDLDMRLRFGTLCDFRLAAKLVGSVGTNLSDADFSLHAELRMNIRKYMVQQIIKLIQATQVATQIRLDALRKEVCVAKTGKQPSPDILGRIAMGVTLAIPSLFLSGVVKAAVELLDTVKDGLQFAERALAQFGTFNIESIILSGTLRGVVGRKYNTLSAMVKGCLGNNKFSWEVDFNPSDHSAFITSVFTE